MNDHLQPMDDAPPCPPDSAAAAANAALSIAVESCAETVRTIAIAAGAIVAQTRDPDPEGSVPAADALGVGAQAALQLGQAADLWTGIAVGLAETRQRILAGADRTINVKADGSTE